ncbi:MAG: ATP-binding protein [Azospirillaceae bacterium]|nr:ATP-binding protein [Azospirillaceae bacterium]
MRAIARTLFGKILLWSVSVQLVTVGTLLALATFYLPESQEAVDNAFSLYADTAVALYERFGNEALDKFLARSGDTTLLQLTLSATDPGTACGPRTPESASIVARGQTGSYCLTVHAKNGGLPESPESRRSRMQITVLLQLVSSAGLSYVIARYLSRPISDLRQAATRLAKGDLTARVGAKFAGRHDEAADLVREFDQMADRVAALIEVQRRLVGDVSHEIKSPLARLNMALGLARRDAEAHAPRQFQRMQREIDNVSQLVRELLTLASLDAGAAKTVSEPIDLGELIADLLANIAYEAPDRAADLRFRPPGDTITVCGDRALLGRAIENVLRNAVFYTAPQDAIEVTCAPDGNDRALITIRDQGPGVPDHALARLFDPFYRVDDARTRQTGGSGIGLAICRRAIEVHDGRVAAHNIAPHGLAIVMDLPRLAEHTDQTHISIQHHNRVG